LNSLSDFLPKSMLKNPGTTRKIEPMRLKTIAKVSTNEIILWNRSMLMITSSTPDNDVIALAGPARPIVTAVAMHVLPNDSNIPDASPIQNIA